MSSPSTTRRNSACPCGSGRRYKHCCGRAGGATGSRQVEHTHDLSGILVVEDFIEPARCRELIDIARRQPVEKGRVLARTIDRPEVLDRDSQRRITTLIKTTGVADVFCPIVASALREKVMPHYGVSAIDWFEWPDVLRYDPGGLYDLHNDAEVFDPETSLWRRAQDRDLSLLVYLNDDFEGGAIEFPEQGQTIRPATGLLVAFPSDHRYAHAARPVTAGTRFVIVSWAAVAGTERLSPAPRTGVVYPDRVSVPPGLPVGRIADAGFFIDPAVHTQN